MPLTELVYCVTITFINLLPFKGKFSFGESQKSQGAKSGMQGGWQTWVIWCFAKQACTTAVAWAGALSWWSWSAHSVTLNATVTQYTSSVNGVSLPIDQHHKRVTVNGRAVRSPLTGCQVTSKPCNWFSRYSKWKYTFRTAYVCLTCIITRVETLQVHQFSMLHNLLYALTIKCFRLTDKPHLHRFFQLLLCGKLAAS